MGELKGSAPDEQLDTSVDQGPLPQRTLTCNCVRGLHATMSAANVNLGSQNGMTPLYLAVQAGKLHVMQLLLEKKAKVDKAAADGSTPLCAAAEQGHVGAMQLLLKHNATVDKTKTDVRTPLQGSR